MHQWALHGLLGILIDVFGWSHQFSLLFNKQVDCLGRLDLDGPLQKLLQVHHLRLSGEFEVEILLVVIYRHADLSPVFFGVRLHVII